MGNPLIIVTFLVPSDVPGQCKEKCTEIFTAGVAQGHNPIPFNPTLHGFDLETDFVSRGQAFFIQELALIFVWLPLSPLSFFNSKKSREERKQKPLWHEDPSFLSSQGISSFHPFSAAPQKASKETIIGVCEKASVPQARS